MKKTLLAVLFTTFAMSSQAGEVNINSAINSVTDFVGSLVAQINTAPTAPTAPSAPAGLCDATHNWNTPCK